MKPKPKGRKDKPRKKAEKKKLPALGEMDIFIARSAARLVGSPTKKAEAAKGLKDKAFELVKNDAFMRQHLETADKVFSDLPIEKKAVCLFILAVEPKVKESFWRYVREKKNPKLIRDYLIHMRRDARDRTIDELAGRLLYHMPAVKKMS